MRSNLKYCGIVVSSKDSISWGTSRRSLTMLVGYCLVGSCLVGYYLVVCCMVGGLVLCLVGSCCLCCAQCVLCPAFGFFLVSCAFFAFAQRHHPFSIPLCSFCNGRKKKNPTAHCELSSSSWTYFKEREISSECYAWFRFFWPSLVSILIYREPINLGFS